MATLADLQAQRNKFFQQRGEQAQGQIRGQTNENVGALQRRFTSMGAANTGAAIAAENKAREAGLEQERQAIGDISGQQLQAGEQDFARQFQAEEAGRGRAFQSAEARMAREAQLGEAEKARQFQAGMADKDIASKKYFFDTENINKLRELDMQAERDRLDAETTAFNRALSEFQAGGGFKYSGNTGTYTSDATVDLAAKKAREDAIISGAQGAIGSSSRVNAADLPKGPQGQTHGMVAGNGKEVWDAFQRKFIPISQFTYDPNIIGISQNDLNLLRQGRAQGTYGSNNLMTPTSLGLNS